LHHLSRGYESIQEKLIGMGAIIEHTDEHLSSPVVAAHSSYMKEHH